METMTIVLGFFISLIQEDVTGKSIFHYLSHNPLIPISADTSPNADDGPPSPQEETSGDIPFLFPPTGDIEEGIFPSLPFPEHPAEQDNLSAETFPFLLEKSPDLPERNLSQDLTEV